jgi:hypothetical protein
MHLTVLSITNCEWEEGKITVSRVLGGVLIWHCLLPSRVINSQHHSAPSINFMKTERELAKYIGKLAIQQFQLLPSSTASCRPTYIVAIVALGVYTKYLSVTGNFVSLNRCPE